LKTPDAISELLRAGRFALVGLGATLIHLAVAQAALAMDVLSPLSANLLGFCVAFVAGFLGHHHFTFERSAAFGTAFRRYGVIALIGFLVNNVVLIGLTRGGYLGEATALTIAILIVPAGTFVASRFWGFVAPALR
jgi:putative flippase GtrA